jgi:nucleolar GTP-binding protein
LIEALAKEHNAYLIQMSNQSKDGISDVKQKSCDILLDHRLTQKAKDPKKAEQIMNRLYVSQPKKRDNIDRAVVIPDTVISGVKKQGPTIKELQEEYGGAGNFYIPIEEHYQLEDDSWKFDRWPEFYLGKNVMDFYDPDIEEKLKVLEEEEDKLLEMERNENELMEDDDDDENSDGVTEADLKRALEDVRSKKSIIKMQHKLKKNLRARSKNKKMEDLEDHLEKIGIDANIDSIKQRIKSRKSIKELEDNQDKLQKKAFDSSDDDMDVDEERVGRKRRRSISSEDEDMEEDLKSASRKESKKVRSMTPAQLKIRASSKIRSMSNGRREGSVPQPHPTRVVPEEQIRLAKKINKRFKHSINVNEADRVITAKKPKHLYAGKRGIGKNDRR